MGCEALSEKNNPCDRRSMIPMTSIFDTLQVAFWSLTYITIIACGVKHPEEHKPMMPYIAGGLNLSWELNALLLYHHYAHIIWSGLDVVIFVLNCRNLKLSGNCRQYIYIYIVCLCHGDNNIWHAQTAGRNVTLVLCNRLGYCCGVCGANKAYLTPWQTADCNFQIAW